MSDGLFVRAHFSQADSSAVVPDDDGVVGLGSSTRQRFPCWYFQAG
ncbi:MAG TPA: hypothetical protein VGP63_25230 [Planctomycetaceae bacterium]|nr:hypothetical protein [Planctomycetaceae bacterium]